ncbi:MAG: ABC transporter permease subunit [Bdellovibrionaceae bacterium]|nr:ABC transporter permease subunit [Pseudobdellovibrionaceae bacterium]
MQNRKILQGLLILFLLSPFFILIGHFELVTKWDTGEFFWALRNSIWQGVWSALLSTLAGLWLAMGLIFCENRFSRWFNFNIFFLLPNFLPNLFVLIGLMSLIDPFPMGTIGVIIVHAFINVGLCGVILKEVIKNKLSRLSDVSFTLGVGHMQFYRGILFPLLKKDLFQVFFLVFVSAFSSFAIPLVVGGGKGINLEILIFEKIKIYNDWGSSVALAGIQSILLFGFSLLNFKNQTVVELNPNLQSRFLESRFSFYFFSFLYVIFFYSYFNGVAEGLNSWSDFELYSEEIANGILGTAVISIGVGITVFGFLMAITRLHQTNWFHRFLNGYTAPSTALIGFAFLVFGPNTTFFVFLKIILGLTLSYIVYLYKMGYGNFLLDLARYKERASLLGADNNLVFWKILFPLTYKRMFLYSGIAAFWATGDYGISKMIASRDISMALLSETFLSHYRIGFSSLLSFILLVLGLIIFLCFRGAQVVVGRKINY